MTRKCDASAAHNQCGLSTFFPRPQPTTQYDTKFGVTAKILCCDYNYIQDTLWLQPSIYSINIEFVVTSTVLHTCETYVMCEIKSVKLPDCNTSSQTRNLWPKCELCCENQTTYRNRGFHISNCSKKQETQIINTMESNISFIVWWNLEHIYLVCYNGCVTMDVLQWNCNGTRLV